MMGVEEILHWIVISWSGNHHKVCIFISCFSIKSGCEVELLFRKELLDVLILYW